MSNRLLPHAVTYYERKPDGEGFRRHLLYPVRVCEEESECDGVVIKSADLFLLRDELIMPVPEFRIGDYFIRGNYAQVLPPVEQGAYRVNHMLPKLNYNLLKLVHLQGIAAGGVSDGL